MNAPLAALTRPRAARSSLEERLARVRVRGPRAVTTQHGPTVRTPTYTWIDAQGRAWVRYATPAGRERAMPLDRWESS